MANFVDWLLLSPAGIKSIREIDDERLRLTDVAIGMDNTRRNVHHARPLLPDFEYKFLFRFSCSILPQMQFELAVQKGKPIGLVAVLVGTSSNSGLGDG